VIVKDAWGRGAGAYRHLARTAGLKAELAAWGFLIEVLKFLEVHWEHPDEGLWEVRGPRRHFTHSKVMAWVAFDRAIKDAEADGLDAPIERWRKARDAIHAQVCEKGFDSRINSFIQAYESSHLDDSYVLTGRRKQGEALFERLLALSNDVGLFSEEYDVRAKRMLGNFPQALTHMALVNTARLLSISPQQSKEASSRGERPANVDQTNPH
jgi:GH15 family glucan-1,4-alpha-glucosidase